METSYNIEQREIIINSSNMPIVRAGFSNLILFLLIISLIFLNQILNIAHVSLLPRILVFLVIILSTLKIYCHSLSRLYITGGKKLVLLGPISEFTFDISTIEKTEIFGIPSSMTILFIVRLKNRTLPKLYFLVAVSTNCGSYQDTKTVLIELFQKVCNVEVG